jgi:hypothetical protein
MPIHLYQSKKTQRYIGKQVYDDLPWSGDQVDPLTLWYADVFFIQRERYLVLVNPLTKFTFFIFRYSKKEYPDFMQTFKEKLSFTLRAANIDPTKYLTECDFMVPYHITNASATAHLSRTKIDYGYYLSTRWHDIYPPQDEEHYNRMIADNIVRYNKKDYDKPAKRFHHELILRRWD